MIERFNFYDIYGYLLPGITLLGLLWLPLFVVAQKGIPAAWSSALITVVLGYAVGHLLSGLAREVFPHGKLGKDGRLRPPSDYILDNSDGTLSEPLKRQIIRRVSERFGLLVGAVEEPDLATSQRRQDAFFLCRRALIQSEVGSYAEQFEGMYTLMRSWSGSMVLAIAYYLGWIVGPMLIPLQHVAPYLLLTSIIIAIWGAKRPHLLSLGSKPRKLHLFWLVVVLFLFLGSILSGHIAPAQSHVDQYVLVVTVLSCLFLARRFHNAYLYFATLFASTVYRDFFVLDPPSR
jgi:hypothetical protein